MKERAERNRTLTCDAAELQRLAARLVPCPAQPSVDELRDHVFCDNSFHLMQRMPRDLVDLLILDPPYNLAKNYNGHLFKAQEKTAYGAWFNILLGVVKPLLKPTATIYVCADWKTSMIIAPMLEEHFLVRNRITWEREKGRGAKANWKNTTEDIWFCTVTEDYFFDVAAVKLKRRVRAPYTADGRPKDWQVEPEGNFRLTHPSNLWTDLTVPFWSMPENTDHPTQKPEKLLAKLLLASSKPRDLVFDPFLGSGTTAVIAKKLHRHYLGIERNREYCCWALKRLELAEQDPVIQGYNDGVFWERNTLSAQPGPRPPQSPVG